MTKKEAQEELNSTIQTYKQVGLKIILGITPNGIKRTIYIHDEKITGIMEHHPNKAFLSFSFDSNGGICTIQNFSGISAYGCDKPIQYMEAEDGEVTYLHFNGYTDIFAEKKMKYL